MRVISTTALAGLILAGVICGGASAAAPSAVAGKYKGTDEGGPSLVTISGAAPRFRVEIQTGMSGCGGGVAGPAAFDANGRLVLTARDGEMSCRVTMTPIPRGWNLQEGEGCSAYHGDLCGFTGAVKTVSK